MRLKSILAGFASLAALAVAAQAQTALSGKVSSQKEGAMEGVVVSAKRDGSTITISVVTDAQGRIVAHDKHVLSLKDNDQSANLNALIDAGVSSFKIEGRYKDLGYVKNVTAHYRQLFDALLEERAAGRSGPALRAACTSARPWC